MYVIVRMTVPTRDKVQATGILDTRVAQVAVIVSGWLAERTIAEALT